ncbi:PP2A regulatory subunit TAP46-like [Zingiber officinale]|uniref:PP2A regulatory subunit TAP46-like n=1 Tax=Zingiber officinale TaxID=94328 RepID=UPI001C4D659D|nr:PP2A regulatory subunit TAP46-like [Zingiber officinale]
MGEWKVDDIPLPALFEEASKIHSVASGSSVDQDVVRKGIQALRRCDEMISKLGLFSSNETKDDVSTVNLKYLLVPYYIGELTEKAVEDDRIKVLKISQDHLKEFISICETLELVPEAELESSSQGGPDNFATRRARKIARFKWQRAAEAKLQEIKEKKERRHRSLRAAALSSPVEVGEEDVLDDDGEEEREAWLTTISLSICKAFDLLDMLKKEEEMLIAVKDRQSKEGEDFTQEMLDERANRAETWHRNAASRAVFSKPAEPITCATFAQDVIEGRAKVSQAHEHKHQPMIFGPASLVGGRITSERERIQAQVFQPGHRLPTMSIEEAGLREMEIMQKWQERNAKMMEEASSSWHKDITASTTDDDDDAEVEKARAWDDWKDENPRGAGNKKLTPCG